MTSTPAVATALAAGLVALGSNGNQRHKRIHVVTWSTLLAKAEAGGGGNQDVDCKIIGPIEIYEEPQR